MKHTLTSCYLVFLLSASSLWIANNALADSPEDIIIVVNKSVTKKEVTVDELRDYFLLKRLHWPDGKKIVPINVRGNDELRVAFRGRILEMSETEENRYWQDRKIKSGLKKPPELGSNLRAVFKIKGSISYVYRKDYKEGVARIVLVLTAQ